MQREFVSVHVGVLMVSDAPTTLDEATSKLIAERLTEAGHTVTPIEVIKDDPALVRAHLETWLRDRSIDVVVGLAGFESDAVPTALQPLITKQLTGFSELFRVLTYDEIGTASMLTDVIAAQCGTTFVFVLPASKGAVATAMQKILIPQLDNRTKPRNLVMRMPRHKAAAVETSGPQAFPAKENTAEAAVPPPPRQSKASVGPPPPPPKKRNPSVHSTPPMPLAVVAPAPVELPAISRTTSDPGMEIDPAMLMEMSGPSIAVPPADLAAAEAAQSAKNRSLEEALEASIEKSIESSIDSSLESSGRTLLETPKLDDDHPSMVAAREHAEKTPEAQAAAWVQAVEAAASKQQQKTIAEREAREAKRVSAEMPAAVPEPVDEKPVVAEKSDKAAAAAPVGTNDEPRGKIEKASGRPATKPDREVASEDAVIVEDPDLVAAEKRLRPSPSIRPADKKKEPEMPLLLIPRVKEPEVPVFGAREVPPPQRQGSKGWMLIGGLAVIAAVVLIVLALGRRDGTSAAATDPNTQQPNPPNPPTGPTGPTDPATDPTTNPATDPATDPATNPATTPATAGSDIEMDPTTARNDPKPPKNPADPKTPKDPKTPRTPKDPKDPAAGSDDPDLTKAPSNPTTADECDEVSCILGKFSKPCCERYKPAGTPANPPTGGSNTPPAPDAGPVELDKTLIRVGVERFRPQVIACGEKSEAKGTVKIDVSVRPDGMVDSVTVAESPDPALGSCVAGVMKKATFAKTQKGGSFSYPFVF